MAQGGKSGYEEGKCQPKLRWRRRARVLLRSCWSSHLSVHHSIRKLKTDPETSHLSLWFSRSALGTMDGHVSGSQDMLFWL